MRRPSCPRQVASSLRDNPCRQSIGQNLPSGRAMDFVGISAVRYRATSLPSDQPRMCAGVSICPAKASATAAISNGSAKGASPCPGKSSARTSQPAGRRGIKSSNTWRFAVPTVYQINFFGGVWHECSFLVAQFETAQCATLRIMPRFRFRRPLPRLRKRFDGIFYRRGTKLPFVFPPCRGRGSVRQLSEKAARI